MKKIPWSEPDFSAEDKELVKSVIDSEWYSQGKYSRLLEAEICRYTDAKYCVFVNNGTSALIAAFLVSGLQKGDEVLVPSFTFIATVNSLLAVGLKPLLVDCNRDTFNVSVKNLKDKITPRTKAVLAVDVYGLPFDIDEIKRFCSQNNLLLIEDAAEALGAEYKEQKIGGMGHLTIFSFHIAKICTSIEGGAVIANDEETYQKLKMIREHGMLTRYNYEAFGLNFKSSDLHCALGYNQMLRIDKFIKHRQALVERYKKNLPNIVAFQKIPEYVTSHPHMIFGTLVPPEKRDSLNAYLNENGVDTRICWVPCHKQKYHSTIFGDVDLPNSEAIAAAVITPPMGNRLSYDEVDYICDLYKKKLS